MGIYDRDYYRKSLPRGGFAHFTFWSVTTWLIVINIGVFMVDGAMHRAATREYDGTFGPTIVPMSPLTQWGYFSTEKAIYSGQIWRFITFQFLHESPGHLLYNMIALFFFGPIVEGQFGQRRFLAFY